MEKQKRKKDKKRKEAERLKEYLIEIRQDPVAIKQVRKLLQTC